MMKVAEMTEEEKDLQRCKRVVISAKLWLMAFLTEGATHTTRVVKGLPEGCRMVSFFRDPMTDCYNVIVTHPSFPPLDEGAEIPQIEVLLEKVQLP